MWSWWDCMQWWNSVGNGTAPWLMFLPMMLWPIAVIGGIAALVMLLIRNGRTFTYMPPEQARGEIDRQEYEERKGFLSQR